MENAILKRELETDSSPSGKKIKCEDEYLKGNTDLTSTETNIKSDSNERLEESRHFILHNGQRMPKVQFGTYKLKGEDCRKGVLSALRLGYEGLDTASVYDNEKEVGIAIAESNVDRRRLFIQTKLWRSFVGLAQNGKPRCDAELRKSLRKLGTSYIDLWLMHWPGPGRHLNYPPVRMGMNRPKTILEKNLSKIVPTDWTPNVRLQTYKSMAKHVGPDKEVRGLGVCNFSVRQLRDLIDFCRAESLPLPCVVQNECHPLLLARDVRELCESEGIVFQAYASLGAGALGLVENPTVVAIAERHNVNSGQVLLRWALQHNLAVLPKSAKSDRQLINSQLWHFSLHHEEMAKLDGMDVSDKGQNTMAGWLREQDPDAY